MLAATTALRATVSRTSVSELTLRASDCSSLTANGVRGVAIGVIAVWTGIEPALVTEVVISEAVISFEIMVIMRAKIRRFLEITVAGG